jgi:hypothetical protein
LRREVIGNHDTCRAKLLEYTVALLATASGRRSTSLFFKGTGMIAALLHLLWIVTQID